MKIERLDGKNYSIHYNSFEELLGDKCKTTANQERWDGHRRTSSNNWYGRNCNSVSDFVSHVENGWQELTTEVKAKADTLKLNPDTLSPMIVQSMRRKRIRSDSGSDLDIHRVYQGHLDTAWASTRHEVQSTRKRAAHIYINIDGNANENAIASQWRAAAAYRVCEMLQRSGFSVEITVGTSSSDSFRNGPHYCHMTFTAKASSMPLDLNRLAIQSTLGWLRTYMFASLCYNDLGYSVVSYFGRATHNSNPPYVQDRTKKGDLTIAIHSDIKDQMSAMNGIRQAQQSLTNYGKAA